MVHMRSVETLLWRLKSTLEIVYGHQGVPFVHSMYLAVAEFKQVSCDLFSRSETKIEYQFLRGIFLCVFLSRSLISTSFRGCRGLSGLCCRLAVTTGGLPSPWSSYLSLPLFWSALKQRRLICEFANPHLIFFYSFFSFSEKKCLQSHRYLTDYRCKD